MDNKTKLEKLLSSDIQAKRFYDTLSPSLQSKLASADTGSFIELMNAVRSCETDEGKKETFPHTASSNENTGMIPQNSDLSPEKWKQFGELSQ